MYGIFWEFTKYFCHVSGAWVSQQIALQSSASRSKQKLKFLDLVPSQRDHTEFFDYGLISVTCIAHEKFLDS